MNELVLRASGIRKSFRSGEKRIEVLRGVDLELRRGESLSIRGSSGSGKTTLIHILAGLDSGDEGTLFWEEEPVRAGLRGKLAKKRATFIGMVFQSFYLIPELKALDNVLMTARIAGLPLGPARERARDLLTRVGLGERIDHLPTQLSGGEMQRVAVARALMNRPQVILADEPTGNLDEITAEGIMDLLLRICSEEKTSLVLVTHNRIHAERTSHQAELHLGLLR
ncbi:MAG TPA: ABC transporter ATP-binding protein [Opitutales bacterium]|nr:ABC transporter ATP-binding protein [Opitutales bacterium]